MVEYIDREALLKYIEESVVFSGRAGHISPEMRGASKVIDRIKSAPATDVVEVKAVSEQIIRKQAEVSDYWQNDVKQYRATQGYSKIEHDVDNFLRGYNEAVNDMLAIFEERRDT